MDSAQLLAELASAFISVAAADLELRIERGAALVARFLGADRCQVFRYGDDSSRPPTVYEWCAEGITPFKELLEATPLSKWQWSQKQLAVGEILEFPNLDALPKEAVSERSIFAEAGLKSMFLIPLFVGERVLGAIACGSVRHSGLRSYVDRSILVSIAEIFANGLARLRAEQERAERVEFERLTARLAADFISLAPDRIEDGVRRAVAELGRYAGAARVGVFVLPTSDAEHARLFCEWIPEGAPEFPVEDVVVATPPGGWIRRELLTSRIHRQDRTAELPDEIGDVREMVLALKIHSGLSFPLVSHSKVFGWLGLSAESSPVPWPDDLHSLFKILAEIIANALERLRMHKEIEFRTDLQSLLTEFATGFINLPVEEMEDGVVRALGRLAGFMSTDRAGIFLFEPGGETARLAYEWRAPGTPDSTKLLNEVPTGPGSWARDWIMQNRFKEVRSLDEIPEEHVVVRELFELCAIRNVVYVPIESREESFGWLSLANSEKPRAWPKEHVGLLEVAAEMFASALGKLRYERDLDTQRNAMAQVHRVGTMNELAAGIAHELHQPLTAVANYTNSIKHLSMRSTVDAQQIKSLAEHTAEQAIRAGDVIHGMRAHIAGTSLLREPYAARELVRDALALMTHDFRTLNVITTFEIPSDLPPVVVQPVQIQQVVVNLLRNAADALLQKEGGERRVTIGGRLLEADKGAVVEVSIEDNGPGFRRDQAASLFDQFVSSKHDGLGLGLSISRALIEAHGGGLSAESDGENGAVFRFTLPVANEARA
jgi:signal transduction histidine kinase